MWICVGPRDPDTKPSRGRLCVYKTKGNPRSAACKWRGTKVITEKQISAGGVCKLMEESKAPKQFSMPQIRPGLLRSRGSLRVASSPRPGETHRNAHFFLAPFASPTRP